MKNFQEQYAYTIPKEQAAVHAFTIPTPEGDFYVLAEVEDMRASISTLAKMQYEVSSELCDQLDSLDMKESRDFLKSFVENWAYHYSVSWQGILGGDHLFVGSHSFAHKGFDMPENLQQFKPLPHCISMCQLKKIFDLAFTHKCSCVNKNICAYYITALTFNFIFNDKAGFIKEAMNREFKKHKVFDMAMKEKFNSVIRSCVPGPLA